MQVVMVREFICSAPFYAADDRIAGSADYAEAEINSSATAGCRRIKIMFSDRIVRRLKQLV